MPNYCFNELVITGEKQQLVDFIQANSSTEDGEQFEPLLFSKAVPEPELEPGGWHDWRVEHWGTKWEPECTDQVPPREEGYQTLDDFWVFDDNTDSAFIGFDTAWSPPIEWLEQVSALYPDLVFSMSYEEPGMAFRGVAQGKNGIIDDFCENYTPEFEDDEDWEDSVDNTESEDDFFEEASSEVEAKQ
jgi:hypothetical protein